MITNFLVSRGFKGLAARALIVGAGLVVASALIREFLATSHVHGG